MTHSSKQIFKNTTALAIARVSTLIASFVLSYFLARNLGAVGLGAYTTITSWYIITDTICGAGMRSFLTRDIARDLTQTNRYMTHSAILTSALSLLANILVILILVIGKRYTSETTLGIILIDIALFPATWATIYESVFIAHQRAEFVTYTMLVALFLRIGGSVYLLLNGHGVTSLIAFYVVLQYISFGISTYFIVHHIVKPHWEFDPAFFKQMLLNLRIFTPIGFLSSMLSQVEVLVLSWLKADSAVGIFSAASKLTMMWLVIPESYMRATFPAMAAAYARSKPEFHVLVNRSVKYMMALAFPLAIGIAVMADWFIPLFYGEDFAAAIPVLQFLAIIFVPIFLNEILWRILIVRDEQHLALNTQIAGVIVKVGVSLLLVPLWSYMGTVYSLLASQVIYTAMHIFFVQRRNKPIPFINLSWRFALAALVMGFCARWLTVQSRAVVAGILLQFDAATLPGLVSLLVGLAGMAVVALIACVIYGVLLYLLRAFTAEELDLFRSLLRRRKPSSPAPDSTEEK